MPEGKQLARMLESKRPKDAKSLREWADWFTEVIKEVKDVLTPLPEETEHKALVLELIAELEILHGGCMAVVACGRGAQIYRGLDDRGIDTGSGGGGTGTRFGTERAYPIIG